MWQRLFRLPYPQHNRYGLWVMLLVIMSLSNTTYAMTWFPLPPSFDASVVHVVDGDTIDVRYRGQKIRLRLVFIDAPEKKQAYGRASQRYLAGLIYQQKVHVRDYGRDRYGRRLAVVSLRYQDINLAMIAAGYAWHYRSYAQQNQDKIDYWRYKTAQRQARQKRLGLWQDKKTIAPWQWRKKHHKK